MTVNLAYIFHKLTARYRKNSLFSFLLKKTGNDLKERNWIFILGCYNSGTTLLNKILAAHPRISGLPDEGVMLTNKLLKPEDFGWRRMWVKCEKEIKEVNRLLAQNTSTIKRHWSHCYKDNDFLVEKSISNVCRIPFFQDNFQPAHFIHIVRNGYAVSEGIRRKAIIMKNNPLYGMNQYPIELCAKQWVRHLQVVEEHKENLKNYIEISYEELTANPEEEMKRLTTFLGIEEFPKDFLNSSFSIHEKESKIENMNERSFSKLNLNEIQSINKVAGEYLVKYGYGLR